MSRGCLAKQEKWNDSTDSKGNSVGGSFGALLWEAIAWGSYVESSSLGKIVRTSSGPRALSPPVSSPCPSPSPSL